MGYANTGSRSPRPLLSTKQQGGRRSILRGGRANSAKSLRLRPGRLKSSATLHEAGLLKPRSLSAGVQGQLQSHTTTKKNYKAPQNNKKNPPLRDMLATGHLPRSSCQSGGFFFGAKAKARFFCVI